MNDELFKSLGLDKVDADMDDAQSMVDKIASIPPTKTPESTDEWEVVDPSEAPSRIEAALAELERTTLNDPDVDPNVIEQDPVPLDPSEVEIRTTGKDTKVPDFQNTDITTDYDRARQVTYGLQDATLKMVSKAMVLAIATENPRAYGIFNDLVNTVRSMNKDLMDIQKTVKEVTRDAQPVPDPNAIDSEVDDAPQQTSPGRNTANLLRMLEEAEGAVEADLANAPPPEECNKE